MTWRFVVCILCAALAGCGEAWEKPRNLGNLDGNDGYMAERRSLPTTMNPQDGDAIRWNEARCKQPQPTTSLAAQNSTDFSDAAMPLSPGDLVRLTLPGSEPPPPLFKVDSNFVLSLNDLGDLSVRGLTIRQAEAKLSLKLVENRYYRPGHAHVTLSVLDRAPIRVRVAGAVFLPGQVLINGKGAGERDVTHDTASGDHALGRALSNALSVAGGVRPDADVWHISVLRAGQRRQVDMSGMITGNPTEDLLLADGDSVEVPSRGCFQLALVRPSPITPPGVRTFISNLTVPSSSNAQSAVNHDATNFPYGINFLQALVSGNCVGGIQSTNADRYGVLISMNPITGKSEVIERRVEDLVRRADRDSYNPVILPNDAVACYDSGVTNLRDVARTVLDMLVGGLVKP